MKKHKKMKRIAICVLVGLVGIGITPSKGSTSQAALRCLSASRQDPLPAVRFLLDKLAMDRVRQNSVAGEHSQHPAFRPRPRI